MRSSVAAAVAVSAIVAGCGRVHAENGGQTISRNYQVGNFQAIEVAGPYDVEVRTGGNPSVSGRGSEKVLERTVVEVRGDKLVIRPEKKGWFGGSWSSKGKASFTVTVPRLQAAAIAGSGDIRVDRVQGGDFKGAVAGSGDIRVAAIDVDSLQISIAGSGDVTAGNGRAQSARYDIAGSGDIDAASVTATDARVSIAGSGNVRVNATGTADVRIVGSGDVDVKGGAKCNVKKSGSGEVRCS